MRTTDQLKRNIDVSEFSGKSANHDMRVVWFTLYKIDQLSLSGKEPIDSRMK
jgi:hypothetical protein